MPIKTVAKEGAIPPADWMLLKRNNLLRIINDCNAVGWKVGEPPLEKVYNFDVVIR
jgi:hypothetical protein